MLVLMSRCGQVVVLLCAVERVCVVRGNAQQASVRREALQQLLAGMLRQPMRNVMWSDCEHGLGQSSCTAGPSIADSCICI